MSDNAATYSINFTSNGGQVFASINQQMNTVRDTTDAVKRSFGDCYKVLMSVSLVAEGMSKLNSQVKEIIAPGVKLNSQMMELSAITGVTGKALDDIEKAARATAKTFGTDASQNVESYKLILSQLDPEIAKNSDAMKLMGENVNILSKQMGGDTVAATNVLTTSMNQFGVSTKDPIAAAKIMGDMMNVMSAGAQAGSAELPLIQAALEQVGMVAKTTNMSFIETNAQIQLLDKSGKKGAEGGVALRNVLTTLSEGRYASKDAIAGLEAAGIKTSYLANTTIPLTDRLRSLRKIQGDTALMTKIFGKENMAAAIAMINGADYADDLAKQMKDTNSATEQAGVIMGSYQEKMNRAKAVMEDWKIAIFNATEPYLPYIEYTTQAFEAVSKLMETYNTIKSVIDGIVVKLFKKTTATAADTVATEANTTATAGNTVTAGAGSVVNRIFAATINSVRNAWLGASTAAATFSTTLMSIPVIGWVLAGITLVIIGLKLLWDHSKRFREILFGVGYAGQAIFHNIGVVVTRVWNLIIKPIAMFFWSIWKAVFTQIWEFVKIVWEGISTAFLWIWNSVIKPVAMWIFDMYVKVFKTIWGVIKSVFNAIFGFVSGVWDWIKKTFSGFASWIESTIIDPIRTAFSGIWKWITDLLDGIFNKLGGLLKPIRDLWNKIFSKDGMSDITVAYKEGEKAGAKSFDEDQAKKEKEKQQEADKKLDDDKSHRNVFDVSKGYGLPVTTIGGDAADKKKKKKGDGEDGTGRRTVGNLNVNKLVENIYIQNQNGTQMSKEAIVEMIKEALLTAVADFTLAQHEN
ncbi:MAG: phage tail tape measure protein [Chryseobacterium sp.]|nr:phage tail tape measure protein [Chryseobacterium sp.]